MESRTERFWKNIRKNEKESGHYYTSTKTPLPSHSDMDKMGKYGIIYDVDPQIRNFVIAMNRIGYKTEGSCAGHRRNDRGFVTMKGDFSKLKNSEKDKIVTIAHNHGLKNLRLYNFVKTMYFRITFDPVGIVNKNNIRKNRELES
jgi:hypothetical protein